VTLCACKPKSERLYISAKDMQKSPKLSVKLKNLHQKSA